jgi:hypothetical protein
MLNKCCLVLRKKTESREGRLALTGPMTPFPDQFAEERIVQGLCAFKDGRDGSTDRSLATISSSTLDRANLLVLRPIDKSPGPKPQVRQREEG